MATERNTRIRASQISSVLPNDLEAINALVDTYVPAYDSATGKFEWVAGGGSALTVKAVDGNPSISNVVEIQIDEATGLVLTELSGGIAKISLGSHWKNLNVTGQNTLIPSGEETLEFEAGSGIVLTTNSGTTPKKITITASGSSDSYTDSFVNADLSSAGILVVTHSLNTTYPFVIIYDSNNLVIEPDEIEYKTANQIEVDLSSFGTLAGTWNIRVGLGGGAGASSYTTSFDSGDLSSADILVVTHSLGQKYVLVQVYDNNDNLIVPDDVELVNTNSLNIDLSGFTVSGTWNIVAIA